MIYALLDVVLPVFLVLGAGYVATRVKLFKDSAIDGLIIFTQNFAIPCLLFRATMNLDLQTNLDWRMLLSFYVGGTAAFVLGILGARYIFNRRPGEAVSIAFGATYSNTVMLGLPIMERAYGPEALAPNFAIVALHAPVFYLLGITVMEVTRADGRSMAATSALITKSLFKNALMIGIGLGLIANLTGFRPPTQFMDAIELVISAALPTAIFALGGVLTRYKIRDQLGQVAMIGVLSLFVHPGIAYVLSVHIFDLPAGLVRAAVLTAAMAPGVNAYIFASMYNRATGVTSSSVLLLTMASIVTVTFWLSILP